MIYLSLILLFLAGAARGFAEVLQFSHNRSIFAKRKPVSFFGSDSWLLKFKPNKEMLSHGEYRPIEAPKNWYYKLIDSMYIERFWGSTTILVLLTDGFHLFNFAMKLLILFSIITYNPFVAWYWAILIYSAAWSGGFAVSYNLISIKNK